MISFRTAILNTGDEVEFEELKLGDIFNIKEPDGEIYYEKGKKLWYELTAEWDGSGIQVNVKKDNL